MSTNQCVARGWTFAFSQKASCMKHEASGLAVNEITSWGGCPWVVFTPTISELSAVLAKPAPQLSDRLLQPISQVPRVSSDVTAQHHEPPMSPISKVVEPLEAVQLGKLSESEMLSHRLKGHVPYASWCEHCVKARGVNQHRGRGPDEKIQVALTADFMFVEDHKVLVFHERSTGCIGAVVMTGDVARDRNIL
jgi:hypothetical protein